MLGIPQLLARIRLANLDDAPLLAELAARLFEQAFGPANTPEDIAAYLAEHFGPDQQRAELDESNRRVWIASDGEGRAIGYASLLRDSSTDGAAADEPAEVERIYVDREFHGRTVGELLMRACVDQSADWQRDVLWLAVREHHPRAIASTAGLAPAEDIQARQTCTLRDGSELVNRRAKSRSSLRSDDGEDTWCGRRWNGNNIEDRRGQGGGFGGGMAPMGIGGAVVLLVLSLIFGRDFIGGSDQSAAPQSASGDVSPVEESPAEAREVQFVSFVLDSAQAVWARVAPSQLGTPYHDAKLVLFRDGTQTSCGVGQTAMGPFYCPNDEKVYVDLSFFDDLKSRFGAPGEFAQAYVIAHELGHHVQKLTASSAQFCSNRTRIRRTISRCGWSSRRIVTRACSGTTCRTNGFSIRAMWMTAYAPPPRWVTIGFSARRRDAWCRSRSRTARRRSERIGFARDSIPAIRRRAIRSDDRIRQDTARWEGLVSTGPFLCDGLHTRASQSWRLGPTHATRE